MNSKEIVKSAISFQAPARLPLFFRTDPAPSDIVQVDYRPAPGFPPSGNGEDEWGCVWENVIGTGVGQVARHPISNWTDLESYSFPTPHSADRFRDIEAAVETYPDKYIAASVGLSGFSRMWALRGFEDLLTDIYFSRDLLERLADRVFEFEFGIIEEFAKRNVNGAWFFDDWGTERMLMIRPDTWREIFKPRYAEEFRFIHDKGMHVFFHSCGYVWDIIPDLIEIRVDVLNLEQPLIFGTDEQNGIDRLADNFAREVCFCMNVDSQRTLIFGAPNEIEEEVEHIIRAFRRREGGLICFVDCGKDHNIVPSENIRLVRTAFEKYQGGEFRGHQAGAF